MDSSHGIGIDVVANLDRDALTGLNHHSMIRAVSMRTLDESDHTGRG